MDDISLVEIRLARTRWKIKQKIFSLARFFGVEESMEQHPHITLFGPFTTNPGTTPDDLLNLIGQIARKYETIPFTIGDWERREGLHGGVIAFSVRSSDPLRQLTREIAEALSRLTESLNHWDSQPEKKWFHVTVANMLKPEIAEKMYATLQAPANREMPGGTIPTPGILAWLAAMLGIGAPVQSPPDMRPLLLDDTGLRITIMCGQEILGEYDLLEKRWIRGEEIHDPASWQRTMERYRKAEKFEIDSPRPHDRDIFLISDLHLGHANIIRYCSRPFVHNDAPEMDRVLIRNWNYTIDPEDPVYHLGDLRYGRHALTGREYKDMLNGEITFIRGNHDDLDPESRPSATLEYGGLRFLLVHDPADAPADFDGWVIHGHHHNNDLRKYPFMNFVDRRINVSIEVLGYVPVGMLELVRMIKERESSGIRDPILLRYRHPF